MTSSITETNQTTMMPTKTVKLFSLLRTVSRFRRFSIGWSREQASIASWFSRKRTCRRWIAA